VLRLLHHVRGQAVGYLALFIALSGTTYAATTLPSDEGKARKASASVKIGPRALKTNSVTARAIRRNAVRGSEVKESTLGVIPHAADSALLGGSTLAQVRSGIDAASLGGTPRSGFLDATEVDARLPRAAEQRSVGEDSFSAANPLETRISVDLTAPRAGFAFVAFSTLVHPSGTIPGGPTQQCAIQVNVPEITQVGRVATFETGDLSVEYETIAHTHIVPIDAGTATFSLRFSINPNVSQNCTSTFSSASTSLNAIWIPNAG
jgi:hypothetical protein